MSTKKEIEEKVVPLIATDFKVMINYEVYRKVYHWIHKSDFEVSGFGNVEWDKERKIFRVTDAILLKQENTAASSEIDPTALSKAVYEMRDKPNGLKWWWHSHVDMGVFWSADDMTVIRELGQQGWLLSTVFNKKSEHLSAFYETVEVMGNRHEIFENKIDTKISFPANTNEAVEWDKEYDDKVTEYKYTTTNYESNYSRKETWEDWKEWSNNTWDNTPEFPKFDRDGWAKYKKFGKSFIYNPARDFAITKERRVVELLTIEDEEFSILYKACKRFKKLADEALSSNQIKEIPLQKELPIGPSH